MPCRIWESGEQFAQASLAIRASLISDANGRSIGTASAPKDRSERRCQLSRPWYARCVGGAAAGVGRSFARLLCCPALTEWGRKGRAESAKLTMRRGELE